MESGTNGAADQAAEQAAATDRDAVLTCSDLLVQRAVQLFVEQPAHRFTVEELAKTLGTSRAVLNRRFHAALGQPPLAVLRSARMERAAFLLAKTQDGLAKIADQVGYDTAFALSRAFFKHTGVRPSHFRKQHQETTCVAA